ncbi:MAG: YbaB/EbfC family nucleoid-associated protein [Candidatus Sericytochromatia bacterium]|nr:YbaB/EbfC family nucleoid-associated protein [Candidatus Sericytochromatia bacterium]
MRKMPSGFPGGMGGMDLGKMMRQAQKMQEDLQRAQEGLKDVRLEGTAGGGVVTVTVDGHRDVVGLRIRPEAVDPDDVETLEDLVLGALKDAQAKARVEAEQRLGGIAGSLGGGLPGLF